MRNVKVYFRFTSLDGSLVAELRRVVDLDSRSVRALQRDGSLPRRIELQEAVNHQVVVCFALTSKLNIRRLGAFISKHRIPQHNYGVWVSLTTDRTMDGTRAPKFVVRLLQQLGGVLDYDVYFRPRSKHASRACGPKGSPA